jgi:hypothetical protein
MSTVLASILESLDKKNTATMTGSKRRRVEESPDATASMGDEKASMGDEKTNKTSKYKTSTSIPIFLKSKLFLFYFGSLNDFLG